MQRRHQRANNRISRRVFNLLSEADNLNRTTGRAYFLVIYQRPKSKSTTDKKRKQSSLIETSVNRAKKRRRQQQFVRTFFSGHYNFCGEFSWLKLAHCWSVKRFHHKLLLRHRRTRQSLTALRSINGPLNSKDGVKFDCILMLIISNSFNDSAGEAEFLLGDVNERVFYVTPLVFANSNEARDMNLKKGAQDMEVKSMTSPLSIDDVETYLEDVDDDDSRDFDSAIVVNNSDCDGSEDRYDFEKESAELECSCNDVSWRSDSNRLSNIEQTIATGSTKNSIRTETATELKEINCPPPQQQQQQLQHHNNNNSISKAASVSSTRTNSINSLPSVELEQQHGKKVNGATLHSAMGAMANILEKKSPPKLQTGRKTISQKQQKANSEDKPMVARNEFLDPTELQQLRIANRHSCNGRLDFESIEQQQQLQTELIQKHQDKNIEAFGVLIQYLVYELDAFSCPKFKNDCLKSQDTIQKTLHLLDEAKHTCTQLQDQLCDKEAYYAQREEELQNLHRCELEKARSSYSDLQKQAKEEIAGLESQLCERDIEHQRIMSCYRLETDNKITEQLNQLRAAEAREQELQARLAALDATTVSLQAKLTTVEEEAIKNANIAAERERALNARIVDLTNELEMLQAHRPNATHERTVRDRSELSHDEIAILRPTRSSYDSRVNVNSSRAMPRASLPTELTRLESEVESLRCVLEMRQSEISRLSKQNEELLRDADDRAAMIAKISKLNADIEMLKSELEIKTEKEKEYLVQIDKMQKDVSYEKIKRTRLGFDNEALQWQLKQRSEQLHIVEAKLHETINSSNTLNGSMSRYSSQSSYSGSSQSHFQTEHASPPLSPIIKGIIEKADSVAYVLEIDDETPEIAASKMVKRASSFRSIERNSGTPRRQLSVSANTNGSGTCMPGPNPLSQSMSAASVIRQHSSESATELNGRAQPRIRSRSVSIKDEPAATSFVESRNDASNKLLPPMENDQFCTSSPYANNMRPRTSTLKVESIHDEQDDQPLYKRLATTSKTSTQPRLITCDTSALNSGERLDERMLPSHPSLHDLKVPKQFQQIKESAGEAMVSGANSEDEGCSASSDDMISMHSSTSTDISAAIAPLNMLESAANMSLEQVLLMDKINSLSDTPMEMSWSDDVIESNELPTAALAALNASSNA